ncbi:MAG: hypothetical protein KGS44_13050 [Alphaproteobacteria bacterium]|nr:hypothetical protein [Alphaproteobacteria bacterium]
MRLFHWLLVVAIALAFLSSEEESALSAWHNPIGWFAALLIPSGWSGASWGASTRGSSTSSARLRSVHTFVTRAVGQGDVVHRAQPSRRLAVLALLALTAVTIAIGVSKARRHHRPAEERSPISNFPLSSPETLMEDAREMAGAQGVSINQFLSTLIAL